MSRARPLEIASADGLASLPNLTVVTAADGCEFEWEDGVLYDSEGEPWHPPNVFTEHGGPLVVTKAVA